MKKRISYILLIVLLMFLKINIIDAAACKTSDNALVPKVGYCPQSSYGDVIVQVGGKKYLGAYTYWQYGRQFSHKNVYCVKNGDSQPVYKTCSVNNSLYSNSVRAAIGYIIANYNSDYAKAQYLIHRVLELFEGGQSVVDYSLYQSEYEAAAQQKYNYDNKVAGTYYLATLYSCGSGIQPISDGYTTEVIPQRYTNTISHWTWGYVNDEGNNGDKRAFHLGNTTFEGGVEGNTFVMDDSRKVTIPNGFYLNQSFGTSAISGSWNGYSFGTTVTQRNFGMGFEYDYSPYNYTITYNLNGGINSSSNPSTYNVLYGVTFSNPTRTGYDFAGWYTDANFTQSITGINQGANASFTSPNDLYTKLNSRTTGNLTIYAKWEKQVGTLKIKKVTQDGTTPILFKDVTFYVYPSSDCSGNAITFQFYTGGAGEESITLDANNHYSVKEIIAPEGYGISDECIYIGYLNSGQEISKSIVNKTQCEIDFEKDSSISNRLELYKTYKLNKLLDFTINNSADACSTYTPDYGPEKECLQYFDGGNSAKETGTQKFHYFSEKDLSSYNDVLKGNDDIIIGYCITSLDFLPSYSLEETGYNYNVNANNLSIDDITKVKAGRMIFNIKDTDIVGDSQLLRNCYIHEKVYENYKNVINTPEFNITFLDRTPYIKNVKLDDIELRLENPNSVPEVDIEQVGEFIRVTAYEVVNYFPNPVYVEKITGKQPENQNDCLSNGILKDSCRILGYGVASKFNDAKKPISEKPYFNFSIEAADNSIFESYNEKCYYEVEPEIIEYDTAEDKGQLELEFRVVDTNKPFNRNTKSNWSAEDDNSSTNNKVTQYITGNDVNNSYNKTGEGSLYQTGTTGKIILTPELVQQIREYNKSHSYNDYTVYTEVVEGEEKTSTSFFDYIGLTKVQ